MMYVYTWKEDNVYYKYIYVYMYTIYVCELGENIYIHLGRDFGNNPHGQMK